MDVGIIIYFPLFLISIFFAFYIPGNIFVASLPLTKLQKLTLSISFGIVLWALQGFIFGYLHARLLTYIFLLSSLFVWVKLKRYKALQNNFKVTLPKFPDFIIGILIGIAVLTQLITSFANGISIAKGIYFCCGLPDSLFHIALTNELVTNFPPHEPGLSGILLKNYHFLSNLTNADLIRIFHIPLLYLQYPYTSLLITLLFALNILTFSQLSIKKQLYSYWLLFFVFFSGDILFLLTLILGHGLNFHSSFLENASWLWISPPRVYGAMLLFAGLSFLILWINSKKKSILDILIIFTLGILIGFKIYFAIFALVGLAALLMVYFKEKNIHKIIVIILTFLISIGLYLPINSSSGGFVFTGFWRFDDFAANGIFGLQKMELARYIYLAHGNWVHAYLNSITYFIIYFIFIFGTLLVSLFQTKKSLSLFDKKLHIFLISGLFVCFIFGSFFIQKTGGANSSQFLITDMIILPIYAALALFYWSKKIEKRKILVILLSLLIVVLTVPRVIYETITTASSISYLQGEFIDSNQLAALTYLRNNTPQKAIILQNNPYDCVYLSFLAQRQSYICLDGAPGDRSVSTDMRLLLQKNIFKNNKSLEILRHNRTVQYLYMPTSIYLTRTSVYKKYNYLKRYSNEKITILQVY
jgi:hypothetical protein